MGRDWSCFLVGIVVGRNAEDGSFGMQVPVLGGGFL